VQPGCCGIVGILYPHEVLDQLGLLGLEVRRAVLEPEQVAWGGLRRRRRGRTAEAELRPAQRRRPERDAGQVADRVHGDLGIVGAGLHAQVAVGSLWRQGIAAEVWKFDERGRPTIPQAEPGLALRVGEQRRAEPERDGQSRSRQAESLTGVVRR